MLSLALSSGVGILSSIQTRTGYRPKLTGVQGLSWAKLQGSLAIWWGSDKHDLRGETWGGKEGKD